jgi:SWI/SNF-related matrix-associated actin-dependent regulator 1 of chromatin subfamily A
VILLDEAHYIKNNSAKRTKAFKRLNKRIPKLIALTGTPIDNRPVEIYNVVQAVDSEVFPNYFHFIRKYCGAKKTYFGWDTNGATNMQELHEILKRTVMIRRKKSEVLSELPAKQFVNVPIQIDNAGEYQRAEIAFTDYLQKRYSEIDEEIEKELKRFAKRNDYETGEVLTDQEITFLKQRKIEKANLAPFLVQIEYLKQLAVEGKFKFIKEWIEDFLDSGEKLVVFGVHRKFIAELCKMFPNALQIDGGTSMKDRQKAVDEFQNNPKQNILIANIRAAGVGITLTASSNVMVFEFPWSPSILSQAIDRLHRIGQLKQVTAWFLVGENTIEEKILKLLKDKENLISQVLDGVDSKDSNIIRELIKGYRK